MTIYSQIRLVVGVLILVCVIANAAILFSSHNRSEINVKLDELEKASKDAQQVIKELCDEQERVRTNAYTQGYCDGMKAATRFFTNEMQLMFPEK